MAVCNAAPPEGLDGTSWVLNTRVTVGFPRLAFEPDVRQQGWFTDGL